MRCDCWLIAESQRRWLCEQRLTEVLLFVCCHNYDFSLFWTCRLSFVCCHSYNFSPWDVDNDHKPVHVLFMFRDLFSPMRYVWLRGL